MSREYDLVILGGGIGGYVAAIRASQRGLKTALVEKEKVGGTCLHKGCIPSKTFLESASIYAQSKKAKEYGIEYDGVKLNFSIIKQRKEKIVNQLFAGVQNLLKKGKIDVFHGLGRILGPSIFSPLPGTISVEMNDGSDNEILIPKNVIIATGSSPKTIDGIPIDGKTVMLSDHAFEMEKLPESIIIVGGGVIGIEWASMLADFGVKVTIVEASKRILPQEDEEIVQELTKHLKNNNITIYTNSNLMVDSVEVVSNNVNLTIEKDQQTLSLSAEKMLISIGRIGNSANIGLENTAIHTNGTFIQVNENYQTSEKHIYAIGDVIGGLQLAHVASHEGIKAVEHIVYGKTEHISKQFVPKCIYCHPEVASVGFTEQKARDLGYKVKVAKFPFSAIGKAHVTGQPSGFVKMIKDLETEDILGVHMIGPKVTELIGESVLALQLNGTPWEIANTIHPHPSLSEILQEVSFAIDGKPIHF